MLIAYIVNILTPLDRIFWIIASRSKAQEDGSGNYLSVPVGRSCDSKEGLLPGSAWEFPPRCELLGYTGAISGLKNGFYGDGLIEFELDRAYKKGEVAEFGFTIRQEDMLAENKKAGGCPLYFMPGWFNEIAVEHYLFVWEDGTYVMETNADRKEGGFYVWEGGLKEGERRRRFTATRRHSGMPIWWNGRLCRTAPGKRNPWIPPQLFSFSCVQAT